MMRDSRISDRCLDERKNHNLLPMAITGISLLALTLLFLINK
jgi:hypothetical protein